MGRARMPTRAPAARAAASTASTSCFLPSRPTRASGASIGGAASPAFRRTRSVDQVGRKSETTRVITCLQFKICTFARAGADQFDKLPDVGVLWICSTHGASSSGLLSLCSILILGLG